MVTTTVGETYSGLGGAMRRPFQDFNLLQDRVPDQLEQAIKNPYETKGLDSCEQINARVAALDIALGPDLDTPKVEGQRDRWHKGASSAADYAVAAAGDAADHFIPVRGVIRQLSGANKADKHAKEALLAGSVRRGFLKAVGMQQGCGWPAAPVDFDPQLAVVHRQHTDPLAAMGGTGSPQASRGQMAVAQAVTAQTAGSQPVTAQPVVAQPVMAKLTSLSVPLAKASVEPALASTAISPIQALATPPARSSDYVRADQQVRLAERATGARPGARRGVVERAPVGQSVVLPPHAGASQAS